MRRSIALLTATAAASRQDAPLPPVVSPLPEPPVADRTPGARVILAEYRHDDLLWENDRTAHRIYGLALRVDPAAIVDIRQDADNYLILLNATPAHPFVYYAGSAWSRGVGGFRSAAAWTAYARQALLDFQPTIRTGETR